ncbi:MAG: DNA-directed RNA polymerase subunit beta, partial [Verrucomicrobia bacterium 21-51-4]
MTERKNFGKLKEVIAPPSLIENQVNSYLEFLQMDVPANKRASIGLQAVFSELFPIESYDGRCTLEYVSYTLNGPRSSEMECLREGTSYAVSLYVQLRLSEEGVNKDEEIYMGEIPMITQRGCRRRRKFLITTLLRAMGYSSDADILNLFYKIEDCRVREALDMEDVSHYVLVEDIVDAERGVVLARSFEPLTKTNIRAFEKIGIRSVRVIDTHIDDGAIIRAIKKDPTRNEEEALRDIYKRLRPGEPPTAANARALLKRLFQDPKRYDLGRVGRYKLNQKLGLEIDLNDRIVHVEDIVEATRYLCKLKSGDGMVDDIDHLGSRRVRNVGELLANQCRVGLARTERLVKERMTLYDQSVDSITPQKLINPKALTTVIRDFFARSQLSQFMDQINPLSELTHKRRLSALGPGGLNRDRAGFEVRDVHPSHYGRICPIETPEGPNIGLINSLSIYASINEFGFIETPYRRVTKGVVSDSVDFLTADQEENHVIAQANSEIDAKGRFIGKVTVRRRDEVYEAEPLDVDYMDVSPKQLVSVAAGLIPFLEHDDANRALMGSNMQRQGVPLLRTEAPFVGTGLEKRVAEDSKTVVISAADGVVADVDARCIVVTTDGKMPQRFEGKTDEKRGLFVYELRKFMRSNNATCFNQKPVVHKGQPVKKGDLLADGASTDKGDLALGRNVLAAFMPWNGYNFEDAILISEALLRDDVYTSIHIEEFEVTARDTKLGPEEITRDIPNVGEEALKNLNRDGVICVGAEVKPGDILVGKVTPKSETELAPEEKLLRAIFGEKAADVKDTSLVVPSGIYGIVMDVKVSSRTDNEQEAMSPSDRRRQTKKINEELRGQADKLREELTEALSNI